MKKEESIWLLSLKWLGVLPVAIIGSLLSFWLWSLIHLITISRYIDPDSWLNVIFMELMANGIMGAAFVYAGSWLAPKKKKVVSFILTGIVLVLAGMSLFATFLTSEYFSLISIIAMSAGAGITAYSIATDDIEGFEDLLVQPVDGINSVTAPPPLHRYISTFCKEMKKTLLLLALLLALWIGVSIAARHAYLLPGYGSALTRVSYDRSLWRIVKEYAPLKNPS